MAWALVLEGRERRPAESVRARVGELRLREGRAMRPEHMSPREWRLVPGVGETRALALVRHRWSHAARDGPWPWMEAEGIGAVTEARIRAWFGERGIALDGDALASRAQGQSVDSAPAHARNRIR
jgi:hypothetical protein